MDGNGWMTKTGFYAETLVDVR